MLEGTPPEERAL
ncbi:hypothetical protein E2320_018312, partial [Naja naja]